jgi:hypothetical protein
MAAVQDQLNALRELAWLYSQAKLWGAPRRFRYAGASVKRGRKERQQLQRETVHAHIDTSQRIRDAQKRLLATGYSVPDSWLTVRAVGQVSSQYTVARKGKPETAVLIDSGADQEALDAVCREMHAAMLRLEAQVEAATGANVASVSAAQTPVEEYDTPLTLIEFIKMFCVSGDKLPEARLDSLTKSLQNAARRKETEVTLPKHVGDWRPGQKKYYFPSQLQSVWPRVTKRLPYLPPLKPTQT